MTARRRANLSCPLSDSTIKILPAPRLKKTANHWNPLNKLVRIITTASAVAVALSIAITAPALAEGNDVSAIVEGGALSQVAAGATLSGIVLDGQTVQHATGGTTKWTLTDARGTGAVWAMNASATDFVSEAGTSDKSARTIPASNLLLTPGDITATSGSDAAPTATALTLSTTAQTLISAGADTKGTFSLTPTFNLSVPVNAYRSNFSGVIGDSTVNPYVSTITFTIG